MGTKNKNITGFTIVELLIVIVVIAILAAITIMAFNGVQDRARIASLQSDLTNASRQMKLYHVEKNYFPIGNDCTSSPAAQTICLKTSPGTTVGTFQTNNSSSSQSFCITATNKGVSYRVTNASQVVLGDCLSLYATGGTITDINGYRIHTFTSSGQFTAYEGLDTVEALVVAGGGGAGNDVGGGGGGGGVIYNAALPISPGAIPVTIGLGGASRGGNGGNSILSSMTAIGGGGGGTYSNTAGKAGGSGGGGGGGGVNPGGTGTSGQGFEGGTGSTGTYSSGAGGGAGSAGGNATNVTGYNGGDGKAYDISGTLTYYGGGGGGGGSTTRGLGGIGGGGDGEYRTTSNGQNGAPNTGGGAGGHASPNTGGATGGSGIVIIRYRLP